MREKPSGTGHAGKLGILRSLALALGAAALVVACDDNSSTFSLYRSSVLGADRRMHVATFDAREGEAYNRENCSIAAELFGRQPGVTVRYWCEKGRFRP